jgi:hypothetical protein
MHHIVVAALWLRSYCRSIAVSLAVSMITKRTLRVS